MLLADSTVDDPVAAGRTAQLLLALLVLTLFPIFLLMHPIQTHSVKLDLPRLPEASAVPYPYGARFLERLDESRPLMKPGARAHRLSTTPGNAILFDGAEVDLETLRGRLNLAAVEGGWVDFSPEPDARYELFFDVLALTRRARLDRLRLDSRPFRRALDETPPPFPVRSRRHR
ncbi:MAG TPA: hypothetical protein VF574_00695 [Allosphingosinicella sp.]|jgi:biopolymer transport protein ExbD